MGSVAQSELWMRGNVEQVLELALFSQTLLALLLHALTFCLAGWSSFREISMTAAFGVECSSVHREIGALETRE